MKQKGTKNMSDGNLIDISIIDDLSDELIKDNFGVTYNRKLDNTKSMLKRSYNMALERAAEELSDFEKQLLEMRIDK